MMDEITRVMGIDFGLKRVGIAISDPLMTFAYSLTTLRNDPDLFSNLNEIIVDKNVRKIILGIPSDENTSSTSIFKSVKKFKDQIIREFGVEVIEWDETYTSVIAKNRVLESVTRKSKRRDKRLIDMNSASIILQEYLDSINR